jgi:hypothetical protein
LFAIRIFDFVYTDLEDECYFEDVSEDVLRTDGSPELQRSIVINHQQRRLVVLPSVIRVERS